MLYADTLMDEIGVLCHPVHKYNLHPTLKPCHPMPLCIVNKHL